jgi:anti-anti-sigma factor
MNPDSAPRRGSVVHVDFLSGSWSPKQPSVVVRRTRSGRWLVLEIAGEMDLQAGPFLSDIGDDPCFVVFDLHGVTFMDCSSLRVLQNAQHRALAAGGAVRLAAPSEQVLRVLTLTRLDGAFPLFDSVRDATTREVTPYCDPTRRSRYPGSKRS